MSGPVSLPSRLFAELRRRNVFRAAAIYAATAWLLVQVVTQVFPVYGLPAWSMRWVIGALAFGFPFWLLFAWFFELTPSGFRRETDAETPESVTRATGRKLDFWIIGILSVAVVVLLANQFLLPRAAVGPDGKRDGGHAAAPGKSIAVLPLLNQGGNPDDQYFSDGLSEDLITALSQFSGIKVISRNSSFLFRGSRASSASIGAQLGVATLLEGSVRRQGGTVRINATLVRASDGATLWSRQFDRPYKRLFALQDEITQAVAAELQVKLQGTPGTATQTSRPPSGSLPAYNAWLQGNFHLADSTADSMRRAIRDYDRAIALDPRYAQAYAARSSARTILASNYVSVAEAKDIYVLARADGRRAQSLAPALADAYVASGSVIEYADIDPVGAEAEYRKAIALAPDGGEPKRYLARVLADQGRLAAAIDMARQSLQHDPLNVRTYQNLSRYVLAQGDPDEAERVIEKAIALQPDAQNSHFRLSSIDIWRGDADAALRHAREEPPGLYRDRGIAVALQIGSDRTAADAALKESIAAGSIGSVMVAEMFALRKDPDQMFAWLDRAWEDRDPDLSQLLFNPFLLRYRHDPRFATFCRKMGLPLPGDAVSRGDG